MEELSDVHEAVPFPEEDPSPGSPDPETLQLKLDKTLEPSQKIDLLELLHRYNDCVAITSRVRQTPVAKHRIIVDGAKHPIRQLPYRVSLKERETINEQAREMLCDDVTQLSNSPWAAPVVLVKKKAGTLRFCVDYRRLNKGNKKDVYPLPRIDDTLDRLRHSRYFSSIDLKNGYWQIEVDE